MKKKQKYYRSVYVYRNIYKPFEKCRDRLLTADRMIKMIKKKKKNIKDGSFRSYVIGIEERLNVSQQDRNCL